MQITKLAPYAKAYRKQLLLCPIMMIGEVAMETTIPLMIAKMIDVGIPSGNMGTILGIGGIMVLMALCSLAFGVAGARLAAVGSMGFAKCLRTALFNKLQDFSFHNIDKFSTASLVTRLTTDVTNAQNTLMMLVRMAIRAPMMFIMATVMAFSVNSSLVTVFVVVVPLLAAALGVILKLAFPRFQILMKKYDAMNKSVQENLIAIRVVKAFVRGGYEKKKFNDTADDMMESQRAAERVVLLNAPVMQISMYVSIVAVLWFGGRMIIGGTMETGQLFSFIQYIGQILMSLMMLSFIFVSFALSRASISRINEVLDEQPDIVNPEHPIETVENGEVSFDHAGFSYSGDKNNLVLSDIDLHIRSGETIGILGGTGSAKSSLVQLIPRLYDVTVGRVLVGGRDVKEYDLKALRDSVAMVLQKNVLFSGTIAENLRWGSPDATEEELREACQAAHADEFVMSFPDGYQTDLGQGGVNVSGGQKQRLCIARALLKKPKVIIFDDATSAVDTATDAGIRESLRTHMPDTTKIIIAQRVASVMDADRIVILNDGKIAGVGTHEQLLNSNEIYREVYTSQMKGAED